MVFHSSGKFCSEAAVPMSVVRTVVPRCTECEIRGVTLFHTVFIPLHMVFTPFRTDFYVVFTPFHSDVDFDPLRDPANG